jgi:hypothetical protein
MYCISRRANPDRTSFKLYKQLPNGTIKEANYIWTEFQCRNEASTGKNNEWCTECVVKMPPSYKYQANPKYDHGYIGGPYTKGSKLYGSPYYLQLIKDGWNIREEDEKRAKECQDKVMSMPPRKVKQAVTAPSVNVLSVNVPSVPEVQPKKPRKLRLSKKVPDLVSEPSVAPSSNTAASLQFIESHTEQPLIPSDILHIKVRKIKIQSNDYLLDPISLKVYGLSKGSVGSYKGRYLNETNTIDTSYPDSDCELS